MEVAVAGIAVLQMPCYKILAVKERKLAFDVS